MKTSVVAAGLVAAVAAQRPANESICDYYTTALLKDNTAANQEALLTLVVNTAVIGNYTTPNVGIAVNGILNPGEYKGTKVNLLPYFDGMLASTNPDNGANAGVSVNFLDGGAAAPLMKNMPANSTTSNQYVLLTHLYEYFAGLLGCSIYSNTTSPYAGSTNLYEVHRFMALDEAQFGYFVTQVGDSAASFGVSSSDVSAVGEALFDAFGYRCAPPEAIPPTASPAPQAICIDADCPIATKSADCSIYSSVVMPTTVASMSSSMPTSTAASNSTGVAPSGYSSTWYTPAPTSYMSTWTSAGSTYTTPVVSTPAPTWSSVMSSPTPTAPYVAGAGAVAPAGLMGALGLAVAFL